MTPRSFRNGCRNSVFKVIPVLKACVRQLRFADLPDLKVDEEPVNYPIRWFWALVSFYDIVYCREAQSNGLKSLL
jgi:hypothetical protein